MRIVIFSFYSGWVHRGMETVAHELGRRFQAHYSVALFQAGPRLASQNSYRVERVAVSWQERPVGFLRRFFLDSASLKIGWFTLKSLGRLRNLRPEIVLAGNGGWQVAILKLYCLVTGARLVVSGQAGLGWDDRWNLIVQPDLFVALSQRNLAWARQHRKGKTQVVAIPNGVDLTTFTPTGKKLRLKLPKPVVVCVAGPERYKRVEATIQAVQLLKGSLFLISQSSVYDQMGKKLLGKRFVRKSFPHDQLAPAYRAGDVFTLVSESTEAFGIAYVEAMACGLPVVATKDRLRQEIVGQAGILVTNPQDSKAYAQVLEAAAKKDWKNLPRKQAERFSWDKIASQYEKAFNKIVK